TFDNAGEVEASIKDKWPKHYTNHTENGRMVYYRCSKAKLRGSQCSLSIYLLYHADNDKVTIYKTEAEHNHHIDTVRGIDENVKKCIDEFYIMMLGELEQWCQNKVNVPTDENEAFVASCKILYDNVDGEDVEENDGNKFRIFMSSLRLLNIISMSSHLCSDATYKLVWQGFLVLIVGTTDLNRAFHPFGLAICSNWIEQNK
ncbi:unnamed protein product, partial [Rotaria socialis]